MHLLAYQIQGLKLHKDHRLAMRLRTTDMVRDPAFTHRPDGGARNVPYSTAIALAGINASGKTTALRALALALAVAAGSPLSELSGELEPLYGMLDDRFKVRAVFEHGGRLHRIESELEIADGARRRAMFARERLDRLTGRASGKAVDEAMDDPDANGWRTILTRGRDDAAPDRSISRTVVGDDADITADLSADPRIGDMPAPVMGLFDPSIRDIAVDGGRAEIRLRGHDEPRVVPAEELASTISAGTLRGGMIAGHALHALQTGGYLLADDFDDGIDRRLAVAIINLFASPSTNPRGAVLALSTHCPELLDHFNRKDGIWFAVRSPDGLAVENLSDHATRADLKKSTAFLANIVAGTAPTYRSIAALRDYARGLAGIVD